MSDNINNDGSNNRYFGNGIPISIGFDLAAQSPLDHRIVKKSYSELDSIPIEQRYVGMAVFVIDDWLMYRLDDNGIWNVESFQFKSGEGVPDPNFGYLGWMYLDTNAGEIYSCEKDENDNIVWVLKYSFVTTIGPKGDKGDTGSRGSLWWHGTKITGGSLVVDNIFVDSGIKVAVENDIYYNTTSQDLYQCTLAGGSSQAKWSYIGNIRGEKGDKGDSCRFYSGTLITGTSTTPTSFQTGLEFVKKDELYINTYYGTVYQCTSSGNQSTAKWIYIGTLKFNEVAVQDTEPAGDDVKIWIKPETSEGEANIIPYVKDNVVSDEDTYSSKYIEEIVGGKWYFGNINGIQIEKPDIVHEVYRIDDGQFGNIRLGDIYFHRNNYTVYQCITAGDKDKAEWIIKTNLMNPILEVIKEQGYMKARSVDTLPETPEADVIYFIQGEVVVL